MAPSRGVAYVASSSMHILPYHLSPSPALEARSSSKAGLCPSAVELVPSLSREVVAAATSVTNLATASRDPWAAAARRSHLGTRPETLYREFATFEGATRRPHRTARRQRTATSATPPTPPLKSPHSHSDCRRRRQCLGSRVPSPTPSSPPTTETPTAKTPTPLLHTPRAHPLAASARTSRSSPTPSPTGSRASPPSSRRPLLGGSGGLRRAPNPVEIAGRFRAGLARLPGRQAVADLAKIASSLLPPEEDWSGTEAAGVTEDVVIFARDAAMRPELWLDFPLLPDDADSNDFDMTDAQQDHALAVESVAPELADLRIELCPGHMSEGCFWKIYFVLLHPKLTKEDAELLSTPQVLEAREQLSQNFQYQTKLESNEDTVAPTISNADGTVATPVEVVPSLKDQDASARATSFGNVDYGILETIHLDDAPSKDIIGDAGAVSSDNISSSVCVQLVPVLRDATELSQSEMEESIHALSKEDATESRIEESTPDFTAEDAEADEQTVTLVDSFPSKEDQRKQPVSDFYERSKVIIQKADNDDTDDDGDEWLEDTDGSGSTPIQIADDDEDVSFSDLEEDDDAA
ncbi:hypothetical protein ACQ4PT_067789 [Festuca glaucescens]